MRWEQCCETEGCSRPAQHGALCSACFRAATPARRAVELLAAEPAPAEPALDGDDYVSAAGVTWLREVWAA
jgi:hypothetical protein